MIDIHDFRVRPQEYREAARKKRVNFDFDEFLALDQQLKVLKQEVEKIRAEQNSFNKVLPTLKGDEKQQKLAEMKNIAGQLKEKSETLRQLEERWRTSLLLIPSIPDSEVPEGKDDSENIEIRRVGEIPTFAFTPRSHLELGQMLDIIDIERGVKIAGSRSYFLKGAGALLQRAVLQCCINFLQKRGFTLMEPPHLVNYGAMEGTGYFPGGEEMAYHLDERDPSTYLIGTSEVSVCAYHQDEILKHDQLPKLYAGYSPCYRRESGTYGKDTSGLYRVHQFYKVEQVVVCKNDRAESARFHEMILRNSEEFLALLGIPYRVVAVCTGDMGRGQVLKHDIEGWMPSRNGYGETHSCSTFLEFQSRRLQMRYRDESGEIKYCHTLNNTCIATPRILIPLLELNQNADGSVRIPKALQPFMAGIESITS